MCTRPAETLTRFNPFLPTVPTFAVRETSVSRTANVWNGGHEWVNQTETPPPFRSPVPDGLAAQPPPLPRGGVPRPGPLQTLPPHQPKLTARSAKFYSYVSENWEFFFYLHPILSVNLKNGKKIPRISVNT